MEFVPNYFLSLSACGSVQPWTCKAVRLFPQIYFPHSTHLFLERQSLKYYSTCQASIFSYITHLFLETYRDCSTCAILQVNDFVIILNIYNNTKKNVIFWESDKAEGGLKYTFQSLPFFSPIVANFRLDLFCRWIFCNTSAAQRLIGLFPFAVL